MEPSFCLVVLLLGAVNLASSQVANRIVGGQNGNIKDFPWLCSLRYQFAHVCGASVLSVDYLLTAAHCFPTGHLDSEYEVLCGATSLSVPDSDSQIIAVERSYKNPGYTEDSYSFDIAVIKLKLPLTTSDKVKPILLPSANVQLPAGLKCKVAGWGHIQHSVPLASPQTLQVGQVTLISRRTCNCLYDINPTAKTMSSIQQDMICAGMVDGSVDACQGDSGGPLSFSVNGNWYQAGVVSFGDECGSRNRPGVYMSMPAYSDWIKSIVWNAQVNDITIDQISQPDNENGCIGADGVVYPYPNSATGVLVTLAMLPLYWLTAYFLTDL